MKTFGMMIMAAALVSTSVHAEQLLEHLSWSELAQQGQLSGGSLEGDVLRISNDRDEPVTTTILVLDNPAITRPGYAITGEVRYEQVDGKAYLEMWNHFPGAGAYFSRTLHNAGPMQFISDSSDWRSFSLPFMSNHDTPAPEKLVLNVVLPGRGTVYLSSIKLVQDERPIISWWSLRQSGRIGAILGVLLGCAGALIGILMSLGRAPRLIMVIMNVMLAACALLLSAGLVAVAVRQPYHVYFPLLLTGAIGLLVIGINRKAVRRRLESIELRRMESMDT